MIKDRFGITCLQCGYEPPEKLAGFAEPMIQATKVIKAQFADKVIARTVNCYRISKYA
ncbi:hypothetical protein [Candidatus Magnetobacterium casense]|uniref:Uncharacterized protein n=1 Tax=Candidatus Magnetobacterium casense TaxID=1455061 RepID=A0ABS6RXX5_9BACT|nr:hypothetical protein [Candidatus Magnetobacterium casensis]MBV6341473.1 hypothetical protein [Candidatus Magnetobacterium casensis]